MRTNVRYFQKQKDNGTPISMITAYDATQGQIVEQAGIRVILVGDSLGMVVQGYENTVPVTLEDIVYHTSLVRRGTKEAFIVGDMPFMTYNASPKQAIENAARILQDGGAQSVKVEGGQRMYNTIRKLAKNGIPVMAHIGLTPQAVHSIGGWRVQGKSKSGAAQLIEDAEAVQEAGAYAVVLELVPAELARIISERLIIPTIGIGSGGGCDGQVQVFHDIVGLTMGRTPKHAKQYTNTAILMENAISEYIQEVESGTFPTEGNAPSVNDEVLETIYSVAKDSESNQQDTNS